MKIVPSIGDLERSLLVLIDHRTKAALAARGVVLGGLSWVRAAATNKALAVAYAAYVLPVIRGNTASRRHRWQVW